MNLTGLIHTAQDLQVILGLPPWLQAKIAATLILIIILVLARLLVLLIAYRFVNDIAKRYAWKKISLYTIVIALIIILMRIWLEGSSGVATILGLASAGIAIALKDPVTNIAGWVFIVLSKPFTVGDRVQIGNFTGDVIDLRMFQFTLNEVGNWVKADQSTGRIIHIPTGKVFTEPVTNFTKGFKYIWNEIPVMVTYESNWKKAKKILLDIASKYALNLSESAKKSLQAASKKYMIYYSKLTPAVYTTGSDSGVTLTIRYLCEPHKRRDTEHMIWEEILDKFERAKDIDLAYPTRRTFNNAAEGKVKGKVK